MRTTFTTITLAAIITIPAAVSAASGLRSTMHAWRADARTVQSMLSGRASFDEAAIRTTLQTYIADAGRLGEHVNASSGSGREFGRRMAGFQADARTALADVPQRSALKSDVSRLMADCSACHDVFN